MLSEKEAVDEEAVEEEAVEEETDGEGTVTQDGSKDLPSTNLAEERGLIEAVE